MLGQGHPDLSELAYHIVLLRDYWKRTSPQRPAGEGFRALRNMIEIALGVGEADEIARAVIAELDSILPESSVGTVDPEGIEVVFISSLLQQKTNQMSVPAATGYWTRVFLPDARNQARPS